MTPATILTIWRADANRWHHSQSRALRNCGDTNKAHQCRVAQLMGMIFPDATARELRIALHHDDAESITGDVSGAAKRKYPVIRDAHAWAETDTALSWGLPVPETDQERDRLDLCDKLDAFLMARDTDLSELATPDWREAAHHIKALAWRLGVGPAVEGIMGAMA